MAGFSLVFPFFRCGSIKILQEFWRNRQFCDDFHKFANFVTISKFISAKNQGNLKNRAENRPQKIKKKSKLQPREKKEKPKNSRGKRKLKSRCKKGILTQRFEIFTCGSENQGQERTEVKNSTSSGRK